MPTDASSLPDETKTILNDAKFSYHTKFNKFHHYHDFLSSPQWNDFFVLVDNDTVLSLAIPFEDVGKMTRSYLVANRLKANDSLFYYVQIVKKKKERSLHPHGAAPRAAQPELPEGRLAGMPSPVPRRS